VVISKDRAMEIAAGYMSSGTLGMPFATLATTGTVPSELRGTVERELKDPAWNTTQRRELTSLLNYVKATHLTPVPFRWQYSCGGWDTTAHPGCERYADEAVAWYGAHGDEYAIACQRTPRDNWVITSFGSSGMKTWYRIRFSAPDDALDWYGRKRGWAFCEAECRCGVPGMDCD